MSLRYYASDDTTNFDEDVDEQIVERKPSQRTLTKRDREMVNATVVKGATALGNSMVKALKSTDVVSLQLNEREKKISVVKERHCVWCKDILSLKRFYCIPYLVLYMETHN
jgi:hypothetical protein